MSVHVFIGPTLTLEAARAVWPQAVYHPPVRQGDVYRLVSQSAPTAIGIVDGYFTHVPSVWHKEILHAMEAGVPVYGSASMGALRAAELAQFGMVGIGRIFEAYLRGTLPPYDETFEDDDEVAVLHGPAAVGYLALSEALVNLRCTLAEAAGQGVITTSSRDQLIGLAKHRFYQERSYEVLLEDAPGRVPEAELERLRDWLPAHKVNQKGEDAIALLQTLREHVPVRPEIRYTLAETTYWQRAKALVDAENGPPALEPGDFEGGSHVE